MSNTIAQLNWRYATQEFDSSQKLSTEQVSLIKEAFRLSPSSFGLQGWKFIHVTDPVKRAALKEASWGQSKVTDASEFFVLAVPTNFSQANVDAYLKLVSKERNIPVDQLKGLQDMLTGYLARNNAESILAWLKQQTYIALGQVMTVAAIESIDTCPMEGFNPAKYNEILELDSKNLTSVVALAVGFRSKDDKYGAMAKVRYPTEDVFLNI